MFNLSYVEADEDTGEEVTEYFCAHWQVVLLLHMGTCRGQLSGDCSAGACALVEAGYLETAVLGHVLLLRPAIWRLQCWSMLPADRQPQQDPLQLAALTACAVGLLCIISCSWLLVLPQHFKCCLGPLAACAGQLLPILLRLAAWCACCDLLQLLAD